MENVKLFRLRVLNRVASAPLSALISGCSGILASATKSNTNISVVKELAYGPHPRQKLDIYLPENVKRRSAINLFLYGGSWRWGSRNRYAFIGYALAKQGLAVAVADYRLYPEVRFPTFNSDAAQAVAWLLENHSSFGLTQSLNVLGHSAGAQIGCSIILDPMYLNAHNFSEEYIGKFIGLSGPYTIRPSSVTSLADIFRTAKPEDRAIPAQLVRKVKTKMLFLHGRQDNLVGTKNSLAMCEALIKLGGSAEIKIYDNVGHKGIILSMADPLAWLAPTTRDILHFLEN